MERFRMTTSWALSLAVLAFLLPVARAGESSVPPRWLADLPLLQLLVYGSVVGLALSVLILLIIWWKEWRRGDVW
jgi:hypothetical protein